MATPEDDDTPPAEEDGPDSVPSTSGEGKKRGRTSIYMTVEMQKVIEATLPEYKELVQARPLMTADDSEFMRKWKAGKINGVLDDKQGKFAGCIVEGDKKLCRSAWYHRIYQMYDNYHRYHLKGFIEANRQAQANQVTHPTSMAPTSEAATFKMIRGTWLKVIGKTSPREIFAETNPDAVALKKQEIEAEDGNRAFGGGLHNAAVSRAWKDCEDKKVYEEMAENVEGSVDETRKWLPYLMQTATRDLLRRKTVGSAAIKVYMAWRLDDGSVSTSIAAAAYDASQDLELQFPLAQLDAQRTAWGQEAHTILPSLVDPPASQTEIPRWTADVNKASPEQVVQAVRRHIEELWVFSFGSQRPVPAVPYNDIALHPNQFYDTTMHTLPCLRLDVSLEDVPTLYRVAGYLQSLSASGNPFRFLPVSTQPSKDIHPPPEVQDSAHAANKDMPGSPTPPASCIIARNGEPLPPPASPPSSTGSHGDHEDIEHPAGDDDGGHEPTVDATDNNGALELLAQGGDDGKGKAAGTKKKREKKETKQQQKGEKKTKGGKNDSKRKRVRGEETDIEPPKKKGKKTPTDTSNVIEPPEIEPVEIEPPFTSNQPPKHNRAAKKAAPTNDNPALTDENIPPTNGNIGPVDMAPAQSGAAESRPSRRQPKRSTAPKPTAPPSKRTKVSERYFTVVEVIRSPTPPLPM